MKWFKHDSDARTDTKILRLRMRFGMEGYGVFWALVEVLADSETRTIQRHELEAIAYDLRLEMERMSKIVDEMVSSSLLIEDETGLYSPSLNRRLSDLERAIEQRREAGRKSSEKRKKNDRSTTVEENSTTVEQPFNDRSTTVEENSTTVELLDCTVLDLTVSDSVISPQPESPPPDGAGRSRDSVMVFPNMISDDDWKPFEDDPDMSSDVNQLRMIVEEFFEMYRKVEGVHHPPIERSKFRGIVLSLWRAMLDDQIGLVSWSDIIDQFFRGSWAEGKTPEGQSRDHKIHVFVSPRVLNLLAHHANEGR